MNKSTKFPNAVSHKGIHYFPSTLRSGNIITTYNKGEEHAGHVPLYLIKSIIQFASKHNLIDLPF